MNAIYSYILSYYRITVGVDNMSGDKIKIFKRDKARGEDGYKTFSVRIKEETVNALDELTTKTNRSRNELINIILENAVNNVEIVE
jgi:predicted HicB family RNase H-like nuclease